MKAERHGIRRNRAELDPMEDHRKPGSSRAARDVAGANAEPEEGTGGQGAATWNEPKPRVTRPKRGFGALQAEEAGTKRGEETNTEQQLRDEGQGRGKAAHHSGEGRKAWDTPQPRGAGPHGGPPETRKQPRSQGRGRREC